MAISFDSNLGSLEAFPPSAAANPPGPRLPRHRRQPSLAARLVWLVLLSTLPVALFAVGLIYAEFRHGKEQIAANTLRTARALSLAVERQLSEVQSGLAALATSGALQDGDVERFMVQANRFVSGQPTVRNIVLVGPDGRQAANTLLRAPDPLPTAVASPQILSVFETAQPVFTDLFMGLVEKRPMVAAAVPVLRNGKVAYVLAAGIEPATLRSIFERQRLPHSWPASIVDDSGTIVARTVEAHRFVGQKATAELLERRSRSPEGVFEGLTMEGKPVLAVFSRSEVTGWLVAIGIPTTQINQPLRDTMMSLVLVALVMLGVSCTIALSNSRRLVVTVRQLVRAASGAGPRAPVAGARLFFREADELAQAMTAAQLDLASRQACLEAVLESATDAIVVADGSHRVLTFNAQAARRFGHVREQAVGMALSQLVPPQARGTPEDWSLWTPSRDPRAPVQAMGLGSDGATFPIDVSVLRAQVHGLHFHIAVVRDTTVRQRAEQALVRANQDLQQVASAAAHELRAPLHSLQALLQSLAHTASGPVDEASTLLLQTARRGVGHINRLADELLAHARLTEPNQPRTQVNVGQALSDALRALEAQVQESGTRVSAGPLPDVLTCRSQLAQVFQILIGHAIEYRQGRSLSIHIWARQTAQEVVVAIADNGRGIEHRFLDTIFQALERPHAHAQRPGAGLGLAICKRVIEQHGGRIWVEAEPGQGSTLKFSLPLPAGGA